MDKLIKETIKKLEELKDNLNFDNEKNYCDMVNIMIDYDNKAQDDLYLYDTVRETVEFIDEETLPYYIESQLKEFGINRIIYMVGMVEYIDSIYKVNAYGNLENVDNSDFIYCIDETIERLKEKLGEA